MEDVDVAKGELPFSVAASGGLGNRVEASHGTVDEGKIYIDTGFDELGGDEADGEVLLEALADCGEHLETVFRVHEGGEMVVLYGAVRVGFKKGLSMLTSVDDAEGLRGVGKFVANCIVV